MSACRNLAFGLFILLVLSGYAISLTCYSCQDCDDPFKSNNSGQIAVNTSGLYCKKTVGAHIVVRNITDVCSPFSAVGNGVWCCQTDLCNGANQVVSISSFGIVLIIGIISKFV